MNILGIETSCDETAAAVVKNGQKILSSVVSSQIVIHKKYFGVVPELASRAHVLTINAVVAAALKKAGIALGDIRSKIGAIAYTRGPGLAGSLLVGQITAETISYLHHTPLVDVNHLEGHLYAALLEYPRLKPPYLALVVSGGHTELIIVTGFGQYQVLGCTRDDAAGEAYDKVAKLLHLSYPGGPIIDKLAARGNSSAVAFPRPFMRETWDFSFSGLKTAVAQHVARTTPTGHHLTGKEVQNICASFQQAVVDTLIEKTIAAAKKYRIRRIVIGGGVAANRALRKQLTAQAKKSAIELFLPSPGLCTDNAAMIACAGYYKWVKCTSKLSVKKEEASVALPVEQIEPGLQLKNWN
ncbi:MAG: tRNA (adenosine(37)-N6)-threonylcarbamoyltransferase complex transferase subunit TsaD [Endomicrobiales bacterium]